MNPYPVGNLKSLITNSFRLYPFVFVLPRNQVAYPLIAYLPLHKTLVLLPLHQAAEYDPERGGKCVSAGLHPWQHLECA